MNPSPKSRLTKEGLAYPLPTAEDGRGDPTRTGDHLVPNQVRYQLRYAPYFQLMSENGGKDKTFR